MNRDERLRLDELLGRGSLGGPEYDRILDEVLEKTAPGRRRAAWVLVPTALVVSMASVWLLVGGRQEEFRAKGDSRAMPAALNLGCGASGSRTCKVGDTLMFQVNSALTSGYVGAYARLQGGGPGDRIWYFPDQAGIAPHVLPGRGTVGIEEGIRIGPEHRRGRYQVTVWVSARPLERRQIDAAPDQIIRSRATFELEITD